MDLDPAGPVPTTLAPFVRLAIGRPPGCSPIPCVAKRRTPSNTPTVTASTREEVKLEAECQRQQRMFCRDTVDPNQPSQELLESQSNPTRKFLGGYLPDGQPR